MKYDNCKSCASKCEFAGRDREFVCPNGISCKVEKPDSDPVMEEMKQIIDRFDKVELEAMIILATSLNEGEGQKVAVQKAADFFIQAGREDTAKELLEYGEQREKENS